MRAMMSHPARQTFLQSIAEIRAGSPLLWRWALAFLGLFAVLYAGTLIDGRLFNGVSVWEKPAKFFLSLSLHMATLAFGLSLLPESQRQAPVIRVAIVVFLAAASFEMAYITARAGRGEASHFNESSVFTTVMYGLMGLGAVMLAGVTGLLGWRILKHAPPSPLVYATGVGFILSGLLTVVFGGYLSQNGGHWVGGDQTDATGLPFFHWSTTGGDLRIPHFFALHIMQVLPLLGFLTRHLPMPRAKPILWLGATAWLVLTTAVFVQALMGRPLIGT